MMARKLQNERTTLTSRSLFACRGRKFMFAPMNFSICSSVMPPCREHMVHLHTLHVQQPYFVGLFNSP